MKENFLLFLLMFYSSNLINCEIANPRNNSSKKLFNDLYKISDYKTNLIATTKNKENKESLYHKRNLNIGTYNAIYESIPDHASIYTTHAVPIDSNSFMVCGVVLHYFTRNGSSFTKTNVDSGLGGRSCFEVNNNEVVLTSWGGSPPIPPWKNYVFLKNVNGVFERRNELQFDSFATGAAHNYVKLLPNAEYVAFSCFISNVKASVQIYRRINGKYNPYDSVSFVNGGNVRDLTFFRNEYIAITRYAVDIGILVFRISSDFKISTNPVYQQINSVTNPTSILNFDDNQIIVGFEDGTLKSYEFINNVFIEKADLISYDTKSVYSLTKINDRKFSAVYSQTLIPTVSTKTVIYFKQGDTFIFFQEIIGPGGSQSGVRLNVFDDNTIIINYNQQYTIYRLSCTTPSLKNNNCQYCQQNQYREDGICKSKCYNIGNVANTFQDCQYCGTTYNDGPDYNKLDLLTSKCVKNCPTNLKLISLGNSNFICTCKDGTILVDNQCIPSSTGCGKGGYLGNNNICVYCPLTHQNEVDNKLYMHENNCVSDCTALYGKNTDTQNKYYCMPCGDAQLFFNVNQCVNQCPKKHVKYVVNSKNFWECKESCEISSKSTTSGECLTCPTDKSYVGLNDKDEEDCFNKCPSNYTQNLQLMKCIKCSQNEISFNNVCMLCSKRTDGKIIFHNNDCVSSCPLPLIFDSTNNFCKQPPPIPTVPTCSKFTTKSENPSISYKCTDICENENGFFISRINTNFCVRCQEENSFLNIDRKICVLKCPANHGTETTNFSTADQLSITCKTCSELSINKLNLNGKCVNICPEGYENKDNICKLIQSTPSCKGYCLNNGKCSIKNLDLECDCSQTEFIGKKCESPKKEIVDYSEKVRQYLENGSYKDLLNLLESIPELIDLEMKYLIFEKLNKLLDDMISLSIPYNKDILSLADSFYLSANK